MAQQILSTNTFTTAKWIVSPTSSDGTHTTIASALTSAASGDTIFIRPGTYTENLTLKAGVNLTAFECDSSLNATGHVIISGTCTFTAAGTVTISGIQLQTNSAALLAVTGSEISIVNLNNSYLNCTNNTGITYSTSSASAQVNLNNCYGNLGTTGIAMFAHSSAGILNFDQCRFTNTGGSSTANTISAGFMTIIYSTFTNPITASGTTAFYSIIDSFINTAAQNVTSLTHGSTFAFSNGDRSTFSSGSASSISVSAACTFAIRDGNIGSTNTNSITGSGTLNYSGLNFTESSSTINVTTQSGGTLSGSKNTNPSAGFLGETLSSSVTAVALTSATAKSITSIALTPGVWDISAIAATNPTGGTALAQAFIVNISVTDNTLTGTFGIDYWQTNVVTGPTSGVVPSVRKTISATTTYYLVCQCSYTSTTAPTNGRISARRVG